MRCTYCYTDESHLSLRAVTALRYLRFSKTYFDSGPFRSTEDRLKAPEPYLVYWEIRDLKVIRVVLGIPGRTSWCQICPYPSLFEDWQRCSIWLCSNALRLVKYWKVRTNSEELVH